MSVTKEAHIVFKTHFSGQNSFTKQDICNYYLSIGISLSDAALRWRIYDLKSAGIIKSVERGVYTFSDKPRFIPESNPFIEKIVELYQQKYDGLDYCTWNTSSLNSFMIHQPVNAFYLFETDRDITESVFYHFKANNIKVFNNPTAQIMEDYVLGQEGVVVVKPLVSRAPLMKKNQIVFPALEKILVDIFCDQHQFYIYGGQEMITIFENAFHHYNINFSSLYAYATRRGKKILLKTFIEENVLNDQIEE